MDGPVARSERLRQMFNQEKLDPLANEIRAVALLHERSVSPYVVLDPAADPDSPDSETDESKQSRLLAGRLIPQYQPRYIPANAKVGPSTAYVSREFRAGERLDAEYVNQVLAVMLADAVEDQELDDCSAIALIGMSQALGETRLAVVAKAARVRARRNYTKPIMGGIVGTYETYEADTLVDARAVLAQREVSELYYYIEIYTPDGGVGMDTEGVYDFDVDD